MGSGHFAIADFIKAMTTVKITDLPDSCFAANGDLFIEGLFCHLGSAMRFRTTGQKLQQLPSNAAANDTGYRDFAQAGWFTAHEGGDYALVSLFVPLQADHQSEAYPTLASAAMSLYEGEIPTAFKKLS